MDDLLKRLAKLLDLKSIITLLLIGSLCGLVVTLKVVIPSELFAATISSVITYYFTRKDKE